MANDVHILEKCRFQVDISLVPVNSLDEEFHYDSCMKNLKAVKEMGLEAWVIRAESIVTGMRLMIARDTCIHVC